MINPALDLDQTVEVNPVDEGVTIWRFDPPAPCTIEVEIPLLGFVGTGGKIRDHSLPTLGATILESAHNTLFLQYYSSFLHARIRHLVTDARSASTAASAGRSPEGWPGGAAS